MQVLVLNCGSSSVRFTVIETRQRRWLIRGLVERIGAVSSILNWEAMGRPPERMVLEIPHHSAAIEQVLRLLVSPPEPWPVPLQIEAVGHRVVHGGETFSGSVLLTQAVKEAIRDAFDLAPLHNPANLKGIEAAQALLPDVPHVAVFDTAFHQTLPPEAYLYAIPNRLYRRYRIRKYGFHGPSHYYVSRRYYELTGRPREGSRLITLHLGNGASAAAIRDGYSVDTSMGFTPLSGLVMGTRSGDIDPSVIFYLVEKEELTLGEVHALLYRYSGLLGLSGYASDMRDLLEQAEQGDVRAQQALDVYTYRIRFYIGAFMAVLGGLDAIIFTAGVGENSPYIRARSVFGLEGLGIILDAERNQRIVGQEGCISADHSAVQLWVIPTQEELVIALDTERIALAARSSPWV
nr:MAG: acetate kinase [Bacteroidota bacterium]